LTKLFAVPVRFLQLHAIKASKAPLLPSCDETIFKNASVEKQRRQQPKNIEIFLDVLNKYTRKVTVVAAGIQAKRPGTRLILPIGYTALLQLKIARNC